MDITTPPWKSSVAGALTGGLLAASVAVPVTWALSSSTAPSTASAPTTAPQQEDPQPQQLPGRGQDPFGGSTSSQTGSRTDATADQSRGVVLIDTETTAGEAAGTGLVLESSGVVLTNYHVVEGSTSVRVTVAATGDTYDATVVGHDQASDIAVLQLDGASGLATVALDDDGDPAVSDDVTAVGNAEGQGYLSASTGTVVALGQSIDTRSEGAVAGEHLTGLIQTDAYVVGGYSGGALLDEEGEVVGITTAASQGGGAESYAIPIDSAEGIAQQIESGQEGGDVQVGPSAYLGVAIAQGGSGVRVSQVESDGAAAAAGITAGDLITVVDGQRVATLDELRAVLATHEPGDRVRLRWTSGGRTRTATVTLGSSPVN